MIYLLRKSIQLYSINNLKKLKISNQTNFYKNLSTNINYNLGENYNYLENYNYYNPEIYQDIKNVPAVCNGSICPTCKGLGWVNENKYNIYSKKNNKYNFKYNFKNNFNFELCKNCNGTGFY